MSAVTDKKTNMARDLLASHLTDLEQEQRRVERALEALKTPASSNGVGRPPKGAAKPRRRRRNRVGGTRADQAIELINKTPGISASDIAKAMNIKPNYLYRLLGDLEKEGRVRKDKRAYYPAG